MPKGTTGRDRRHLQHVKMMEASVAYNMVKRMDIRSLWMWRVLATGFSFVVFGLGGVFISITVAPVCILIAKNAQHRQLLCRQAYSTSFKLYILMMKWLGLLTYEVSGLENLEKGAIILANHPSLLDVVFTISLVPRANCIIKGSLYRNIFTLGPITASGYIDNDSEDLVSHCLSALESGSELLIFPEGTRSDASEPIKFKRGAANIILMSEADVCPLVITCTPSTLRKNENWYSVPKVPPHFTLKFHPSLNLDHLRNLEEPQSLRSRKLTRVLENYFTDSLENVE